LVSGDTINNPVPYSFTLKRKEQAFINSKTNGRIDDPIDFDALKSNLPNFNIENYYWNFGEGFSRTGKEISHCFKNAGEYTIKLGLVGKFDNLEATSKICVYKKIVISENDKKQEKE
jgi:PKD repeat protein